MKKNRLGRRLTTASLLVVLVMIPLGACKKNENKPVAASPTEVRGELRVLHVSPKGQAQGPGESNEVVAVFDHPMSVLGPLPAVARGDVLKITPPVEGTIRWMGTKTLAFRPKNRLPYGTEFQASIPAGTRSLDGFVLKDEVRWSFATLRPRLLRHDPGDEEKQQRLETDIRLVFNQPVDPGRAKEFIELTGEGPDAAELPVEFSIVRPVLEDLKDLETPPSTEQVLVLKPRMKLKPGFTYAVEVRPGLRGTEGPLGLENDVVFTFETFKPFAFEGLMDPGPRDPNAQLRFRFSNRVIYRDFTAKLRFEPSVEIPDYYSSWDHGNEILYLSLPLQPEAKYTAVVPADLKDDFGNVLGREVKVTFETAAYQPSVRMTSGHGVLEAYGDLTYPVFVMNAAQARIQSARLGRDDVIPLLQSERVFGSSEPILTSGVLFQTDRTLAFHPARNKGQVVPIRIREFLGAPYGFLFIQLDTLSAEKWDRYPKAFLQVTDLGLSAKFSADNDVIWVTDLRTGLPISNADVEIRDGGNTVRWTGRTDKDGKAVSPGWQGLGIQSKDPWSKPKQWVFARRAEDTAVLSSDWGTGLDPYRFNIPYDWSPQPERFMICIFSERGIYRAGETAHLKGILRQREKGLWRIPAVGTVEYVVQDPFQKNVTKGKAELDSFGSFAVDLETRDDASLGSYSITVKIPPQSANDKEFTASETFRVEAFKPAEFEVHLKTLKDAFVFGDSYQADIWANYLYGGVMSGQKAAWTLRLNPATYMPPGHKGFVFGPEEEFFGRDEEMAERSRLISSGEGPLGPDGRIGVKTNLVPEKETATVNATLETTVQSSSRRSISNRVQTLIHRGEFYIGLKPATTFLKKGETLPVEVISVLPDGTPAADKKVTVKLIRREWHSVRKAGVGGRYEWISEKADTEVDSRDVRTKKEAVGLSFKPEKSGLYLVSAAGRDGRANSLLTTVSLYVTGADYVPWERKDDDAIDLVADSDRYRPGDQARILVKSPYEKAKALVTLEREGILESKVVDIVGSASEIRIPITADHVPNVFVSVLLVQGRTSNAEAGAAEDVGKPSFKLGYVNLAVDPLEQKLEIDIRPDKSAYKPREKMTVRLNAKDARGAGVQASLAVAVVDLGVLSIIGYQTPDPFSLFYGERPLSVETSESRLHVVGQRNSSEKAENAGGGGALAMAAPGGLLSEVELRGDFKSTAYWNPSVLTNDHGEATIEVSLPDNLTTFRIMAVAQTKNSRFGQAETSVKVAKPLLLLPSLPRFVRLGDTFEAGVVAHNNTDRKGNVTVGLQASGLDAARAKETQTVALGPGEAKEVLFPVGADKPGSAKFTFRAVMGQDNDGLELTLPVELPRPTESVATADAVSEAAREDHIVIPDDVYPEASLFEIQASASALAGLNGAVEYLVQYPYPCLEQRLSSVLPFLVAPQVIRDFRMSVLGPAEIRRIVRETIREAYACQKDNGGFGLWPDSLAPSPFVSCYTVFALVKARQAGYEVENEHLDDALNYLKNYLRAKPAAAAPYGRRSFDTTRAFALYLLALSGRPEPGYTEKLFGERESLSLFGRSCLLKAFYFGNGDPAARDLLTQELLNKVKVTPTDAHFEEDEDSDLGWIYSSNVRTTAAILQTLVEIGSDHPLLPAAAKWLVAGRRSGRWMSTQDNFFVFYALNEFYRAKEGGKPDFKAEISLAGKGLLEESFREANQTVKKTWPFSELIPGREGVLKAQKTGTGTLYYSARLTYAPKGPLVPRDEGLAVYKKIETLDGKPLDTARAGTLVIVTVEVAAPKESLYVVVEDPLPAGFESVNASFLTESEERQRRLDEAESDGKQAWWQGFTHIEMRDDRVLLFADSLTAGVHTHRYLARVLTPGRFLVPGTKAEEMYAPEVFGRSAERTVTIVK